MVGGGCLPHDVDGQPRWNAMPIFKGWGKCCCSSAVAAELALNLVIFAMEIVPMLVLVGLGLVWSGCLVEFSFRCARF